MAMQVPGELPAFYWEQHYLGTIEPLVASVVFAVARAVGGGAEAGAGRVLDDLRLPGLPDGPAGLRAGPALVSALYLAVPPSFFAAWSVKARGGYPEALALGQLCLLAAQRLADDVLAAPAPRSWAGR